MIALKILLKRTVTTTMALSFHMGSNFWWAGQIHTWRLAKGYVKKLHEEVHQVFALDRKPFVDGFNVIYARLDEANGKHPTPILTTLY